jgi:Type VI secretion system effector, Hcp
MRHHRHKPPGTQRPDELHRKPDSTPATDNVLALQRSAGNHAVTALLARSPDVTKPREEEKSAAAAGARATLPGIGTIALLSVDFGGRRPTGREGEEPPVREIVLSSKSGEHSAKLSKAALDGKPMEVEVIVPRGRSTLRLKLKGAIVSSYSTSGGEDPVESWTLDFESMEQTLEGDAGD